MEVVAKLRRAGVRAFCRPTAAKLRRRLRLSLCRPPRLRVMTRGDFATARRLRRTDCARTSAGAPRRPSPRRAGSSSRTYARTTRASPLSCAVSGVKTSLVLGVTGTDGKTSVAWLAMRCSAHSVGRPWPGWGRSVFRCGRATRFHDAASGGATSWRRMAGDGQCWLVMGSSRTGAGAEGAGAFGSAPVCSRRLRAITSTFTATSSVTTGRKLDWLDGLPGDAAAIIAPKALVHRFKEPERVRCVGGSGVRIRSRHLAARGRDDVH